ncbi:MAG: UvrD-helicase domain-containing protein [Lysobacteraceae bacterium]
MSASQPPDNDWRDLPLAGDGRCLIEASAGTGKTWTIAVLYLRLLLECRWSPRQIIVTTFTIAAAQELRERLRARIASAMSLAAQSDNNAVDDASAAEAGNAWLLQRWQQADTPARADAIRLRLAQAEFDLAPITTLHGVCRKILSDFPFESGSPFGLGEQIASNALDDELRTDLWRRLAQGEHADAGDRAWFGSGKPADHKTLDAALNRAIAPGVSVRVISADALNDVMRPENAAMLRTFVGDGSHFKRNDSTLKTLLNAIAAYIEAGECSYDFKTKRKEGVTESLEKQFKAAFVDQARNDPALVFAERALQVLGHASAPAKSAALVRYRQVLLEQREQRLLARNQLTFDALLSRTHAALQGEHGDALAERLFDAWPVALVDEFQDTDAQQYAILDRIYRNAQHTLRGRLMMIGDPKQAIYRFRGGDIHAYLAAKQTATESLSLRTNYRSSSELIDAFNALYALAGAAMSQRANSSIHYEVMTAGGNADKKPLTIDGEACQRPLVFHVGGDGEGNAADRREAALAACANQIAQMLQERRHCIGGKPLQPGDIAVLLPTNNDIARLRTLLGKRGVPCVGAGKQSVFATDIARDLLVLLYAIEHANDAPALRAALMTRFFGLDAHAIRALQDAPDDWQRRTRQFIEWKQQWQSGGVQSVIQSAISANARAFVQSPNAERELTDARHLGELLQEAGEHCDGTQSLLTWFGDQRAGDDAASEDAADERQLRIESDAKRVRLMTLHSSKGLQFPLVLLPLMWAHTGRKPTMPLVFDAPTGGRVLDLGSEDFDVAVAEEEYDDQDERFRVLYVALTRAQYACHVYAESNGIDKAADPKRSALSALVARLHEHLPEGATPATSSTHIAWSEAGWPASDARFQPDDAPSLQARHALSLPPTPPFEFKYSFSSLTRPDRIAAFDDAAATDEALHAVDAAMQSVEALVHTQSNGNEPVHPQLVALSAIKGAEFGNALHAIFELREIGIPLSQQHDLVRRCLLDEGLLDEGRRIDANAMESFVERVAARVQATLDAPLLPDRDPSLQLAVVPKTHLRAEMEFNYVLGEVTMQRLRAACAEHGEPNLIPHGPTRSLRGLMNGKIDLVFQHDGRFHVLDYKSNFLGEHLSDYTSAALRIEMDRHAYRFQALLYTVAVDRYLRQRMLAYRRSTHLGEAIYLFVRAVGLAPHAGVWAHRFDDALIAAVDAVLAATTHGKAA